MQVLQLNKCILLACGKYVCTKGYKQEKANDKYLMLKTEDIAIYIRQDGEGYVKFQVRSSYKRIDEIVYNLDKKVNLSVIFFDRYIVDNFVFLTMDKEDFNLWGELMHLATFVVEFMIPRLDMNREVNLEVLRKWDRVEAKKVKVQLEELVSRIAKVKVLYDNPGSLWFYYKKRYFGTWITNCGGRIVVVDDHAFNVSLYGCSCDCKICGRLHHLLTKATCCLLSVEENEEIERLGKRIRGY